MKAKILDTRTEGSAKCYLCKISLKDYIENLSDDYKNYDVQREIVQNVFLDNLISTVLSKKHIPPIVLIGQNCEVEGDVLNIQSFKILDGLQRTHRLNLIWNTILFFLSSKNENPLIVDESKFSLSKKYSSQLAKIDSDTRVLSTVIDLYINRFNQSDVELISCYEENYQWFEIWIDLTSKEEVEKMLTLNAGHKPVKIKHQLEILFRNLLPILRDIDSKNFLIVREKETSSTNFSRVRRQGEFHFSYLISSILSVREGKPVTTNSSLIQNLQNEDFNFEIDKSYFNYEFLKSFINSIVRIEGALIDNYNDVAVKWFGREVTLVGIYGAFGKKIKESNNRDLADCLDECTDIFIDKVDYINLIKFEEVRNGIDLSKVNFGNVNKNAVYNAVFDLLTQQSQEKIDWNLFF